MKKIVLLCFTLLVFSTIYSQNSFEVQVGIGRFIKQNTDIAFDTSQPNLGLSLAYTWQTNGDKEWHHRHRLPQVNLNLAYFYLGDKNVLGHAIGLYPSLTLDILKKSKFNVSGRFGWGLGYVSKIYDRKTNPLQNAIGSHINVVVGFKVISRYQLNNRWRLFQSFSLTHFSNASFKKPNLGINIPSLDLGVMYILNKTKGISAAVDNTSITYESKNDTLHRRRLFGGMDYGVGLRESGTTNGPKYMISFASFYMQYAFPVHHVHLGFDFEQNNAAYAFALHTQQYATNAEAKSASRRRAIYIADEIMFGRFGVWLQWGVYVNKSSSFLLAGNHYFKLGSRYHFYLDKRKHKDIHLGFYMKSHLIIAEYFSLALGVRL